MGAGSKPASFASSFPIAFLVAACSSPFPGAFHASIHQSEPPPQGFTDQQCHSCDRSIFGPKTIPGTVKLWESPRQSRGVSHWTNSISLSR